MSELQFPKDPIVGQEYDFPPYKYYWDGAKWKTKGIGYNPVNDLRNELEPRISTSESRISDNESRISDNESKVFEALKRSYADAGFNLVEGSFEEGGVLSAASDVMITASGAGYSWGGQEFPHNVAPGTDPAAIAGFVMRSDAGLRSEVAMRRFTSSQAASQSYYEGELVYITDAGYVFKFSSSRYMIAGQSQSEITFSDNLHILVTAGGMLQFAEFEKLRSVQSANSARFAGKLKDRTNALAIDCYGDSITFGQALADTSGAANKIGAATGFGDGSTHQQWQYNANYPAWINSYLVENLLQSNTVFNYGYSGDRAISGYLRHRYISGSDAATIMYGVNDCLYATSNGSQPSGLSAVGMYNVENYAHALRLFAAKQIMQGKAVTILGTTPFGSLAGFDGSQLAASKLSRAYNAAAKRIADEFGCRFVDVCQDIFTQYGMQEITQEGTHLGPDGLKVAGERIAAALVTVETENRVSHGSVLIANPNLNCVLSRSAANVLSNSGSTTPRGTIDDQRTTMGATTEWITIPFFAETNALVLFVNGECGAAGATFDMRLDDGAIQSDYHFQHSYLSGKPTAQKQLTKSAKFNRDNINISDSTQPFLLVANRGWHSFSIRKVSGSASVLLDSVSFESIESVLASDVYGVTASCSVSNGVLDAGARNVASISQPYPGEFDVIFSVPMTNNKYTVVADTNESLADPIYISIRYKYVGSANVTFNRWNGTAWVKFVPTLFTVKIIGGR